MYHWIGGKGREIQNLVSPHHTGDTYNLVKIFGKVVLEKKILTDDGRGGSYIE